MPRIPASSSRAARLFQVGYRLYERSPQRAYEYAQQTVAAAEAEGNVEIQGKALNLQGVIEMDLGLSGLARLNLLQAANIGRKIGNLELQAKAANNLGVLFAFLGERRKAVQYYRFAYEIIQANPDIMSPALQGWILVNIARLYITWSGAEQMLQMIELAQAQEREDVAVYAEIARCIAYLTLAERARTQGRPDELEQFLLKAKQSLDLADHFQDHRSHWVVQAERNLVRAKWLKLSRREEEALPILQEVLEGSRGTYSQGEIAALTALGQHSILSAEQRIHYLRQALAFCRKSGYRELLNQILGTLAQLYSEQQNWQDAFEMQRELSELLTHENEILEQENNEYMLELQGDAGHAALTPSQMQILLRQAQQDARTDALTGLPNRRALDETLPNLLDRLRFPGHGLHVMLADIDHFKRINDTYSHMVGDEVLQEIGNLFKEVGGQTFAARYGGEELLLAAENLSDEEAERLADRLRRQVKALRWPQFPGEVTISLGLTRAHKDETVASLLTRTDQALYRAKAAGRDCVVWDDPQH